MMKQHAIKYFCITYTVLLLTCSLSRALAEDAATPAIETLDPNFAIVNPSGEWLWYDAQHLTVEGKG